MTATNKHFKNLMMTIAVIFLSFITFLSIHIIPTGYTGVLVHLGQIDERPVQSGGFIFTTPFIERLYCVNNKQQDFHVSNKIWGADCQIRCGHCVYLQSDNRRYGFRGSL